MTASIKLIPESYPGAELFLPLGAEIPTRVAGTGIAQYNNIKRPRRRDLMEFAGETPLQVTFSVIFDAWRDDGNIGPLVDRMYGWAAKSGLPTMPTVIRTEGPIPNSNLRWIVTNLEQVEFRQRLSDFALSYAEIKVTLTEWNDIDLIKQGPDTPAASPAAVAQQRFQDQHAQAISGNLKLAAAYGVPYKSGVGAAQPRTYIVKSGDTLASIAARELGAANRWQEISGLNSIRDPRRLKVGDRLTLPVH